MIGRIRASEPKTVSGGSTGGTTGGQPTAVYGEDATVDDVLVLRPVLAEDATVDDQVVLRVVLAEDATVDDPFTAIIAASYAEDTQVNDVLVLQATGVDVPRSGTPNADLMVDAWTDQGATGVNHGNENLSIKGKSTLGTDERRGFLAVDLRGFAGFTPVNALPGGFAFRLSFTASTSNALGSDDLITTAGPVAALPFTESTVTWASGMPAIPTAQQANATIAQGAAQRYTVGFTTTALTGAVGQYLLVCFRLASTLAPNTVTIVSRDAAATRPTFDIALQRGT